MFYKQLRSLILIILIILISFFLFAACDTQVQVIGEYNNPYTNDEVKIMLRYHGASIAKFENNQWYFFSNSRNSRNSRNGCWIKLENGGAYKYMDSFRN